MLYAKLIRLIGLPLGMLTLSFQCISEPLLIGDTLYHPHVLSGGGSAMAIGDFNMDGYQDMAITSKADFSLVIFLGEKAGKLIETNRYKAGNDPSEIVTADINGDGHLDLVIANHETKYLTLFHGNGDGSFKSAESSPLLIEVYPHPHIVRVEDIDSDGNADLIIDNRDKLGLLLIKGLGKGLFETPGIVVNTGGDPYLGFALGDVNKDGRMDFVTPNSSNVSIVLGSDTSSLSFSKPKHIESNNPFAVELADMNGDDNLDIILASMNGPVTILLGDGKGMFDIKTKTEIEFLNGAKRIAIGDVNYDGISDALVSNWTSEIMVVLGSRSLFSTQRFYLEDIVHPWMSKIKDLNNDKKSDLIISDGEGKRVVVYLSEN